MREQYLKQIKEQCDKLIAEAADLRPYDIFGLDHMRLAVDVVLEARHWIAKAKNLRAERPTL